MKEPDNNLVDDTSKDFISSVLSQIKKFVTKLRMHLDFPTTTVRFNMEQSQTWWHMINIEGISVMQVVCKCEVANITRNFDIRPTAAILKKAKTYGMIRVGSEDGIISCNWTLPIEFEFWVKKPFKKTAQSFSSDIVVWDQFSHAHTIKDVRFDYR